MCLTKGKNTHSDLKDKNVMHTCTNIYQIFATILHLQLHIIGNTIQKKLKSSVIWKFFKIYRNLIFILK